MKMKNIFQKSPIVGIFQGGIAAVFLLAMMMQPLEAQLINNFGAWSAFVKSEGSNKVCYIGSTPNKQRGK